MHTIHELIGTLARFDGYNLAASTLAFVATRTIMLGIIDTTLGGFLERRQCWAIWDSHGESSVGPQIASGIRDQQLPCATDRSFSTTDIRCSASLTKSSQDGY